MFHFQQDSGCHESATKMTKEGIHILSNKLSHHVTDLSLFFGSTLFWTLELRWAHGGCCCGNGASKSTLHETHAIQRQRTTLHDIRRRRILPWRPSQKSKSQSANLVIVSLFECFFPKQFTVGVLNAVLSVSALAGMLCPRLWSRLPLVSGLVSQLVSGLGCCVRLPSLVLLLSPNLSPIWAGVLLVSSFSCLRSCLPTCLRSGMLCPPP